MSTTPQRHQSRCLINLATIDGPWLILGNNKKCGTLRLMPVPSSAQTAENIKAMRCPSVTTASAMDAFARTDKDGHFFSHAPPMVSTIDGSPNAYQPNPTIQGNCMPPPKCTNPPSFSATSSTNLQSTQSQIPESISLPGASPPSNMCFEVTGNNQPFFSALDQHLPGATTHNYAAQSCKEPDPMAKDDSEHKVRAHLLAQSVRFKPTNL